VTSCSVEHVLVDVVPVELRHLACHGAVHVDRDAWQPVGSEQLVESVQQRLRAAHREGGDERDTAAFDAATPKIKTGIVSGITSTASSRPPRRSTTESAAPMRPIKVSAGVPANSVSATAVVAVASRLSSSANRGAATTRGTPVLR